MKHFVIVLEKGAVQKHFVWTFMTLNVKSLCFYCHLNKRQHLRFSQHGVSSALDLPLHS